MEKLIKLLNEYEAERHKTSIVAEIRCQNGDRLTYLGLNNHYSELLCISKGYLFINRLCDKDKIDNSKFYDKNILKWFMTLTKEEKADSIIMNLSIQDNPIEFLCSVLK